MKKALLTYLILGCFILAGRAQQKEDPQGFWVLEHVHGEVMARSMYRNKYQEVGDFSDTQESLYFSGGLSFDTRSYIWHPNFLKLDVGAAYFPETSRDDYVVNPDRAEVRTLKGLDLGATLFESRPLTLSSWAMWNDTYQNRENLTNIRSRNRRLGSSLSFRNRILPLYMEIQDIQWNQEEIQTGRIYETGNRNMEVSSRKSFSDRDDSELSYRYSEYIRRDLDYPSIQNTDNIISFRNRLYLDADRKYSLNSSLRNTQRTGNQPFSVFDLRENLLLRLPANFEFRSVYSLYDRGDPLQDLRRNKLNATLNHQLYESLHSTISYEYTGINHSFYQETRQQSGVNLRYTKKIPTGQLNITYNYSFLRNRNESEALTLPAVNEPYDLIDGEMTLLNRPYVDELSVVVKDQSGTLVYREALDYILIRQGDFLEIQRIPGGQIPNGGTVYVDYSFTQTGAYSYDAHTHALSARVVLFSRFLECYYRGLSLDYSHVEKSDLLVLNHIRGNTLGTLIRLGPAELGAEYELHNSTITPFRQFRYYLNVQKRMNRILLALYGNYRDYYLLDEDLTRQYADLSGRFVYDLSRKSKISLMSTYRKQQGTGIDLDLFTLNLEFKTWFRKLQFAAGADLYRREYLGDDTDYYGVYLQLRRLF